MGANRNRVYARPEFWIKPGATLSLGCQKCPERVLCGGIAVGAPVVSCMDLCCGEPMSCKRYACPNQPRYSKLVNELHGLTLEPYARAVQRPGRLPGHAARIFDRSGLHGPLGLSIAAISLYDVLDLQTGLARFPCGMSMRQHFRLSERTRVILTASGKDSKLERFWGTLQSKATAESIRKLSPCLVATPNFSMHADAPRHDNLVSMKRIDYTLHAFAGGGLPIALHVNARAEQDFNRWIEFLRRSPGVTVVAYEFGTLGKSKLRRHWHAMQLARLASEVGRPLSLIATGGWPHVDELAQIFASVTVVDNTPLAKAKRRKKAVKVGDCVKWVNHPTAPGESIDALFLHNVRVRRAERLALARGMEKRGSTTRRSTKVAQRELWR